MMMTTPKKIHLSRFRTCELDSITMYILVELDFGLEFNSRMIRQQLYYRHVSKYILVELDFGLEFNSRMIQQQWYYRHVSKPIWKPHFIHQLAVNDCFYFMS